MPDNDRAAKCEWFCCGCRMDWSLAADVIESLTDAQRECIQLAYYEGLTYVQVSDRLSANLATIKSRMRDAIRGLRRCLGVA